MTLDGRPRRCFVVTVRAALQSAAFAFVVTGAAHAENTDKTAVPARELQGKIAYCENCHGVSAQGFHGYYPIPRLAGQQPEYIKNQLQAFIEHRRTNNIMFNVAHVLSPAMLDALTASFQKLNPKPLAGAPPKELVAAGKKIYDEGRPTATFRHARPVMAPKPKATDNFLAWPAS
jgi:cytochrome c553